MADNENIFVDFDFQNIIVVDPNKVVDENGNVKERYIKQENLVMFANLECSLPPRTKLSVGNAAQDAITTMSIANVNFLKPQKNGKLTNQYTDEITGSGSLERDSDGNFLGVNQNVVSTIRRADKPNEFYDLQEQFSSGVKGTVDNGMLGITSIDIQYNMDFLPVISITLEDVKGRALFESGNNSPYRAFFSYPYPLFYLTLKGFYGKAVKYPLMLNDFKAKVDSENGNFLIDLKFYTYRYTLLADINMLSIQTVPHMYKTTINVDTNQNPLKKTNDITQYQLTKGYQKILEVYNDYKSKGLIDDEFPALTLVQLQRKLDSFIQNVLDGYRKQDLTPYTSAQNYRDLLTQIKTEITDTTNSNSWYNIYIDKKNYYFLSKEFGGLKIYSLVGKSSFGVTGPLLPVNETLAKSELDKICITYTASETDMKNVNKVPDFGAEEKNAKYKTSKLNLTKEDFIVSDILYEDIDVEKSYTNQTNQQPLDENGNETSGFTLYRAKVQAEFSIASNQGIFNVIEKSYEKKPLEFFYFDGKLRNNKKSFRLKLAEQSKDLELKFEKFQKDKADELIKILEEPNRGIGFAPTLRNILSVFYANGEAYLRLLDDVHRNAWDQRDNPIRRQAINTAIQGGDQTSDSTNGNENLVYPWPEICVLTSNETETRYDVRYPGDEDLSEQFQTQNYSVWPEVEFVEEYITGNLLKNTIPQNPEIYENNLTQSQYTSVNALEYPITNDVYFNKEQVKYLYEIWERLYIISNYTNLNRGNSNLKQVYDIIAQIESNNIIKSLGTTNPFLIKVLKEYGIKSSNFEGILRHISNEGQGESWQTHIRGYYNTPYIKNITQNTYELAPFNFDDSSRLLSDFPNIESFSGYVQDSSTNVFTSFDTFPFTDKNWCKSNLSNSSTLNDLSSVNSTSKVIQVNQSSKVIANFQNEDTDLIKRPVCNFNYITVNNPLLNLIPPYNSTNLKNMYDSRSSSYTLQHPTEGNIKYKNYSGTTTANQTTSIFNTPYFINSIQEGIANFRNSNPYPFVSAAYLFLNSLPLATLREKYKTFEQVDTNLENVSDLDFIFATFKKFNALHKIPYAWILKYGSIWHRYKKFLNSGVDILSGVWNNFDYINNYDPVSFSTQKVYNLNIGGINKKIILQQDDTVGANVQTNINLGFYPKLINDFSVFYRGTELFSDYSDTTIQTTIDNDFYINDSLANANFSTPLNVDTNNPNRSINITSWSTFLKVDTNLGFILPSVGSDLNQFVIENFTFENPIEPKMIKEVKNNNSMYDGSVRLAWMSPNYGYFDNSKLTLPPPTKYVKTILTSQNTAQENFSINGDDSYSNIEEIFSVFNHDILDSFEKEFLSFSKSIYDTEITGLTEDTSSVVNNTVFTNFQYLMRNMFKVVPTNGISSKGQYDTLSNFVLNNMYKITKQFLAYDFKLKYGNPNNFDQRILKSFANISSGIADPYIPNAYTVNTPNALPTFTNQFPLANVIAGYPATYQALQEYVGFSEINGLKYASTGSTIFDFFIDNNIEFSVDNIKTLYPLIRIYATQKLKDPSFNGSKFSNFLGEIVNNNQDFQNIILNSIMQKITKELPNINETPTKPITSTLKGDVTKLSLWTGFKKTNDTWIAGVNISNRTIFEDLLFLDRSGKDIGNEVYLDIFSLNEKLKNLGPQVNLLQFTFNLVRENGFVPFTYPSYINFYGVQSPVKNSVPKIDGSYEFANNLFGLHMNVDLVESNSKIVCLYGGKPSSHLNDGDVISNFKNDAFNMKRVNQNPLIQNLSNKTDWDKSNRLVGFTVDFGTINQGVFTKISVGQENGVVTKEVLEGFSRLGNLGQNRASSNQYLSMYDIYRSRSYKCSVTMLGNALIQPTMYFNLEHVPLFNGPYMITSVKHSINPGSFVTTFDGVRQSVYSYPKIDDYLQTIRTKFIDYLKKPDKKDSKQTNQTVNNDVISENASKVENTVNNGEIPTSPQCTLTAETFNGFTRNDSPEQTRVTIKQVVEFIRAQYPNNNNFIYVIAAIMGRQSFKDPSIFAAYENNYIGLRLDLNGFIPPNISILNPNYYCVTANDNTQYPAASFATFEDCVIFTGNRVAGRLIRLDNLNNVLSTDGTIQNQNAEKLARFCYDYWPTINEGSFDKLDASVKETLKKDAKKMIQLVNASL